MRELLTRICIDPGHGGIDPGTVSGDILEKELNLKAECIEKGIDNFSEIEG